MFPYWSVKVRRAVAAGALTLVLAPLAMATEPEACVAGTNGRCEFTAAREGTHRINVTVPATAAPPPKAISIAGHECPLLRQADGVADGTVGLICYAYLAGGTTYPMSIPASGQVAIIRAEPTHGEPVTTIP